MKVEITLPSGETAVSDTSQLTLKTDRTACEIVLCLGPYILARYEGGFSFSPLSPKPENEISAVTAISVEESKNADDPKR